MEYELYHYGVPGMKWGVRKARPQSNSRIARDYNRSIKKSNKSYAKNVGKMVSTKEIKDLNDYRLNKVRGRKDSARKQKKIEKILKNDKNLSMKISEAETNALKHRKEVDKIVKRMSKDKAVVYTTGYGSLGTYRMLNTDYTVYGTKYKVKAKTDKRAKSKKYNNPYEKRRYNERIVKTTTYVR